jgi:hypothetical protein
MDRQEGIGNVLIIKFKIEIDLQLNHVRFIVLC